MIAASAGVKIMVATRPVDFRNYAEPTIMRSVRPFNPRPASLSTV
ncbi:putative peroxiredoxin [Bradyrhizobium liaoningense]